MIQVMENEKEKQWQDDTKRSAYTHTQEHQQQTGNILHLYVYGILSLRIMRKHCVNNWGHKLVAAYTIHIHYQYYNVQRYIQMKIHMGIQCEPV